MPEPGQYSAPVVRIHGELQDSVSLGPLQSSGGGGTFDGMEARIARLESDVDYIKRDIGELKSDMKSLTKTAGEIAGDVKGLAADFRHAPGKGFIVTTVIGGLTLFAALLIFAQHIRAIFGIG